MYLEIHTCSGAYIIITLGSGAAVISELYKILVINSLVPI